MHIYSIASAPGWAWWKNCNNPWDPGIGKERINVFITDMFIISLRICYEETVKCQM
jgi:hypothetical protein